MKSLNEFLKVLTSSYSMFITCGSHFFLHPFTSTKNLSNSTFTAALRTNNDIESFQFYINTFYRSDISYNEMFHGMCLF